MTLERANIEILSGSRAGERIEVLFNPTEYSIERSNAYKGTPIPGLSGPLFHFINGEADVLSMELFLDDRTDPPKPGRPGVQKRLETLLALMEIDRDLHAPPTVAFVWGKLYFKAIVDKMSRKVTMFHSDGAPARASLSIGFREYKTLQELVADPPLQSSDKSKRRVLVGHDSIWLLAAQEYDDPKQWRTIARYNDVDDPRSLRAGDWLMLPPLEKHGESGPTF